MEKQRLLTGRPSKTFIYLPVYLGNKLEKIVIQDRINFNTRIEVGDSFAVIKRDNPRDFLDEKDELKVVQVKYSFIDGSCIAVLEKLTFSKKEELSEFLKNKRCV